MKADKVTVQARIEDVARVLLDGAMPFQIGPYVSGQETAGEPPWTLPEGAKPLSSRHIRRLVRRAEALIAEAARTNRKRLLQRHLAQRRALYARAVAAGDVRAALAVLDSEAKLEGLLDDEVLRQVEALKRRLAKLIGGDDGGEGDGTGGAAAPGPGGGAPGGGPAGRPAAGPSAGGPGGDPPGGEDDPGCLATEVTPLDFGADAPPVQPAVG